MRQFFFVLGLLGGLVIALPGCGGGPKDYVPPENELKPLPEHPPIRGGQRPPQPGSEQKPGGDKKPAPSAAQ